MPPNIKIIFYAAGLGAGTPHVFRYALAEAGKHDARIVILHAMERFSSFGRQLVELHVSPEKSKETHREPHAHARKKIEKRV